MTEKSFFKKLFTKKIIIIAAAALLIIIVAVAAGNGNGKETAVVGRANIIQKVAATGKMKPNQEVDLGFDKSGRISGVYAGVGESVKTGDIIAALESGEIIADLAKAKASLQEEQIKLRELKSTAPTSYGDAYKNLSAVIKESYADADNAIRNRIDQFFEDPDTNPKFGIELTDGYYIHYFKVSDVVVLEMNSQRKEIEKILDDWQGRAAAIGSLKLEEEADKSIDNLNYISDFLDKVASAVNTFTPADYSYEATVNGYKSDVSSARGEISDAISSIVTAKDKITSSPTLSGGGQFDDILIQEAKVRQAEAEVSSLESSLSKSAIKAPFDGIITLQDAKIGSAAVAGQTLISVISPEQMYVEANISEVNIGKISINNPVSISFDAFPGEEFEGNVSYIEPGDVLVDGVVNYKIRVNLEKYDPKIKSGLTANLEIQTAGKDNVIAAPLYAIFKENDQNFVNKIIDDKPQKTRVVLGMSGNDGMAEIIEGLNEGDIVEF